MLAGHYSRSILASLLLSTAVVLPAAQAKTDAGPDELSLTLQEHQHVTDEVELRLMTAIRSWQAGNADRALEEMASLTDAYPTFSLAHLVYGDMLISMAGQPTLLAQLDGDNAEVLERLRHEARLRLQRDSQTIALGMQPASILQLSEDQEHAVVVDLRNARLYLFDNEAGQPRLVADYYAGIGSNGPHKEVEGDKRTPVGVYFITERLDGSQLPDLYGIAAYPVNYPNNWDRINGRTGSGIWLHGVPKNTWSRAPLSSRGCVTVANADMAALEPHFQVGKTPVVFAAEMEWVNSDAANQELLEFLATMDQWRRDWESRQTDRYLKHYAASFRSGNMTRAQFAAHKHRVNSQKEYIDIVIRDLSVLKDPENDVMVVTFLQQYRSNNLSRDTRKRQYWKRTEGVGWQILTEDSL